MTTSVLIALREPNHRRARVDMIDIAADGTEYVNELKVIGPGECVEVHVYDIRSIRITEVD